MTDEFNPEMLTIARESRELTQTELAQKARIPQAVLSKLEGGITVPRESDIEAVAQATLYPTSFFKQRDRIYGFNASVFFHRKRSDIPAKALKRIHATLNLTRMHVDRLFLAGNVTPAVELLRLIPEDHGGPEEVAQKVRALFQLPDGPIKDLTSILEEAGVVIMQTRFNSPRMDAVSEWVPNHPPIILMNVDDHISGDRYRWTLAHELGHLIMHRIPSEEMEEQANRFASEFLMPASDIRAQLRNLKMQTLPLLKAIWRVSMAALVERAKQLKLLTATQYRYMRVQFGKAGYLSREPSEPLIEVERPTILQDLISLHTRNLNYSVEELGQLLRLTPEECETRYLPPKSLRIVRFA